jgi:methylated-DNA-protein-cysteine methyltransferase-like protein
MVRDSRTARSRPSAPDAPVASPSAAQRAAAILAVVRRIPRGRVTTYGAVAARAGLPRQARLVGKVLGGLEDGSTVPWQRVVAAGGRIAFPAGSDARARQISRLQADGVDAERGRVDLARYGWGAGVGDLDHLLWSGE